MMVSKRRRKKKPLHISTPRAYLDIETDDRQRITVVGIFRPGVGGRQWVRPEKNPIPFRGNAAWDLRPTMDVKDMRTFLRGVEFLMTYNGARFDLPVIKNQLGEDLARSFPHRDLMFDCWSRSLKGGLKKVEKTLGIHRDTDGVDGWEAVRLWNRWIFSRETDALDILLRYNREDVENLEALALRLGVLREEIHDDGNF